VVPYVVQPGLGQPTYQVVQVVPVLPAAPTSGKAIASLVLGILLMASSCSLPFALLLPYYGSDGPQFAATALWFLFALLPILLGHLALRDMRRALGHLAGSGLAIAGLVMGYIGAAAVLLLLLKLIWF
jgi:hypothetical protein